MSLTNTSTPIYATPIVERDTGLTRTPRWIVFSHGSAPRGRDHSPATDFCGWVWLCRHRFLLSEQVSDLLVAIDLYPLSPNVY